MSPAAVGFALALLAAYGVHLLYTGLAFGWTGVGVAPAGLHRRRRRSLTDHLIQAGLEEVRLVELVAVEIVFFVLAAAAGWALYGGVVVPVVVGLIATVVPIASARARRRTRLELARDAWPQMIEEIRLQVVSLGRSVPQALLEVGARAPAELRPAFDTAQREWSISTDFARTLDVLKRQLADPTADAVCETLLVAHQVGGSDVDRRLRALCEDRIQDLQGRKDARAKQAGVRFARFFVLIVPLGMAFVGLTIGDGRRAYGTAQGQTLVLVAFALMGACWVWAGRLLQLPEPERVFRGDDEVSSGTEVVP